MTIIFYPTNGLLVIFLQTAIDGSIRRQRIFAIKVPKIPDLECTIYLQLDLLKLKSGCVGTPMRKWGNAFLFLQKVGKRRCPRPPQCTTDYARRHTFAHDIIGRELICPSLEYTRVYFGLGQNKPGYILD